MVDAQNSLPGASPGGLALYLRLRWIALGGQVFALGLAAALGFVVELLIFGPLLLAQLVLAVALEAADAVRLRNADAWLLRLMLLDATLLVALLYLTGGPHNPFSVLLLVNVALAAFLLPPRQAWGTTALVLGLSALLFVDSRPLRPRPPPAQAAQATAHCEECEAFAMPVEEPGVPPVAEPGSAHDAASHDDHAAHGGLSMELHLRGMWAGYVIAGAAMLYFIARLRRELDARERQVLGLNAAREASERRAGLATLAAGAAHELATPLASIRLAAEALEAELGAADGQSSRATSAADALEDARTIREQAERCRRILERMAVELGHPSASSRRVVDVSLLVADAVAPLPTGDRVRVDVVEAGGRLPVAASGSALELAIRNVVDNALRAGEGAVAVRLAGDDNAVTIEVIDDGSGMAEADLRRAGQPFFTTRPHGEGMGLGLFVARSAVEEHGGSLTIESRPGQGTRVVLQLPRAEEAA
jgi:two-component system sensor histidine kinase RegB